MRIAIDTKWYFGGPPSGITVVRNIVNKIISQPDVDIILLCDKNDSDKISDILKYKHDKNTVNIVYLRNSFNFLTNIFLRSSLLKKHKVDVAMFQNFIPLFKAKKCIYVAYIHDVLYIDYPGFFTFVERIVYKLITYSAKKADHIITITNSEKERIKKHTHINDDKISFVYHGVSEKFFPRSESEISRIKKRLNLPDKYILFVGRLNVRKNIRTLLKAYKRLNNKNVKVVIVGSENAKVYNLKKEVNKLNIVDDVIKLGYVSDEDLYEILAASEMFVFPSFAEGFGLPPIEAMKSGVPTVVSNTTSMPEVCGDASLYFDPNSSIELAEVMSNLFENKTLKQELINKGISHAQQYNWENSAVQIIGILKKIQKYPTVLKS